MLVELEVTRVRFLGAFSHCRASVATDMAGLVLAKRVKTRTNASAGTVAQRLPRRAA